MKIHIAGRRQGKTRRLIERCAEEGGYIVCSSQREAHRVFWEAKEMGLKIPMPITFDNLQHGNFFARGIDKVYIDNADYFLQRLCTVPIVEITMTGDEE